MVEMCSSESTRLRLFTGIPLTRSVRDHVVSIVESLSEVLEGVRWVPPENLHVTLKFLGPCDTKHIPDIVSAMRKASERLPISLKVGGVGGFPSQGSARVIWVGASDEQQRLEGVFAEIEKGAAKCGFPREKRRFRPHITIGRSKRGVRLPAELPASAEGLAALEVVEVALFSSELGPGGARYTVIEKAGFGTAAI